MCGKCCEPCQGHQRRPIKKGLGGGGVEHVEISGQQLDYVQHFDCQFTITFCHHLFQISSNDSVVDVDLLCKEICDATRERAKYLYEQAPAIPRMKNLRDHVIKCVEMEGREAESGYDGEEIHDLPIRPVFDKVELGVVRHMFAGLFDAYECAKGGFYNAMGKRFVRALGDYAN